MKIAMVSLEDGITATGFRKMSAFVESINPDTRVYYVGTSAYWSLSKSILRRNNTFGLAENEDALREISSAIADADVIGFSSMTGYSELTRKLVQRVRRINPRAYQIWGGIHPIIYPEDAILSEVDAICTGEGELAIAEFLDLYKRGADYTKVRNFWFKQSNEIVRNPFRNLMTTDELEALPFAKYGGEEWIYRPGQ